MPVCQDPTVIEVSSKTAEDFMSYVKKFEICSSEL